MSLEERTQLVAALVDALVVDADEKQLALDETDGAASAAAGAASGTAFVPRYKLRNELQVSKRVVVALRPGRGVAIVCACMCVCVCRGLHRARDRVHACV